MAEYGKKQNWIVLSGLVGLSFLFFQFFYPYHLFLKEQIQLFLYTPDYFFSYFNKPAWMVCYTGDFLTQFLYLHGGGAVVLSLILALEWLLSSVIIKRITSANNSAVWALLPAFADWILHCDTLHSISVSVGFLLVLVLFLIYSSIRNPLFSLGEGLITALVGYWLAGSSFLIFPFLIVASDWRNVQHNWYKWILIGIIVFSIPVLLRHSFLLTSIQSFIFPAFKIQSILLPISFIVAVSGAFILKKFEIRYSKVASIIIPLAFILMLIAGIKMNANFNFEKILSLDSETYFGNPDRVIELSKKYDLRNRQATYFTNMALAQKGELPEHLMEYYQPSYLGLIMPVGPGDNWQSIFVSSEVFFLMGDMNMAQHSAMLGNTFSPYQRSSRMMRRLAEINLINNDSAAANKYLWILSKTLFHKKWAESRMAMNHASFSNDWLSAKRSQIPQDDLLRKSNDYLVSLNFMVNQNPYNLIALDYLLCYHILNKDLVSFRKVYDKYGRSLQRPVPAVYGEALLIQLLISRATPEEAISYSINPEKLKDFADYTRQYEQTKGDMSALKERFGKSYWFYYHFATIQKK